MAAKLAGKTASGLECAPDTGKDFLGFFHPVESGIGENRVELLIKLKRLPIHHPCIHAECFGRRHHLRA